MKQLKLALFAFALVGFVSIPGARAQDKNASGGTGHAEKSGESGGLEKEKKSCPECKEEGGTKKRHGHSRGSKKKASSISEGASQ